MPYTKEQTLEAFKKLPEDVKEAMFSVDTVQIIQEVGEKHKLMIDKVGELANETGLVMLGFTHPNQFVGNLADRLEIEREAAKEIAEEINTKVFFPIRENLKKIHGVETKKEEMPPAPPPVTPPPPITPVEPIKETPEAPKPEPEITTPPVIMSMPIDLTKAGKTQAEGGTFSPPADFGTKTREEFFRSLEKKIEKTEEKEEKNEVKTPAVKKVDPYREPTL